MEIKRYLFTMNTYYNSTTKTSKSSTSFYCFHSLKYEDNKEMNFITTKIIEEKWKDVSLSLSTHVTT